MKKQNRLNSTKSSNVANQQHQSTGVNLSDIKIYSDYLDFRLTQWKKCNTTFKKMLQDNKAQQKMLLEGRIHLKMFYRTIQHTIYHELQLRNMNDEKTIVKPQKFANLSQEISFIDITEICAKLSVKLQIAINPAGLYKLVHWYLTTKHQENELKGHKNLNNLNLFIWNKTVAKQQELNLDARMYNDQKISLKTLYRTIQFYCETIVKKDLIELTSSSDLSVGEVYLNSRHHCRSNYEKTYSINIMTMIFAINIDILEQADMMVA
ncbi:MAG: hypothetical protein E6Q32_12645 [Neisseriales bacterium]|nr:MAG: hypothetical protein E6Q32_12645 [Neisseriales bacterium]